MAYGFTILLTVSLYFCRTCSAQGWGSRQLAGFQAWRSGFTQVKRSTGIPLNCSLAAVDRKGPISRGLPWGLIAFLPFRYVLDECLLWVLCCCFLNVLDFVWQGKTHMLLLLRICCKRCSGMTNAISGRVFSTSMMRFLNLNDAMMRFVSVGGKEWPRSSCCHFEAIHVSGIMSWLYIGKQFICSSLFLGSRPLKSKTVHPFWSWSRHMRTLARKWDTLEFKRDVPVLDFCPYGYRLYDMVVFGEWHLCSWKSTLRSCGFNIAETTK